MNDSFLDKFRTELKKGTSNPYARFGFLRNPFPSGGQIVPDVCVDQDRAKDGFWGAMTKLVRSGTSGNLLLLGDARGGKTHFLKYVESVLSRESESLEKLRLFYPVYIPGGQDSFLAMHGHITDALRAPVLEPIAHRIEQGEITLAADNMPRDLKAALDGFAVTGNQVEGAFETRLGEFVLWLSGGTCSQKQLTNLGVSANIKSVTLSSRYLCEVLTRARAEGIFGGAVVLMDEFEFLFSEALSRSKRTRFLQDLRYVIDLYGSSGGLLLLVAAHPGAQRSLMTQYDPLYKRFSRLELEPVKPKMAKEYVDTYIEYGRSQYQSAGAQSTGKQEDPFTPEEIATIFDEAKGDDSEAQQGVYLGLIHQALEAKLNAAPGA